MSAVTKASPLDIGCWIAGSRGQYAISGMVRQAGEWGFPLGEEDRAALESYEAGDYEALIDGEWIDTFDWVHELADDAELWMNEHVAPEGHTFGWWECEFFLWPDDEWAHDL